MMLVLELVTAKDSVELKGIGSGMAFARYTCVCWAILKGDNGEEKIARISSTVSGCLVFD